MSYVFATRESIDLPDDIDVLLGTAHYSLDETNKLVNCNVM